MADLPDDIRRKFWKQLGLDMPPTPQELVDRAANRPVQAATPPDAGEVRRLGLVGTLAANPPSDAGRLPPGVYPPGSVEGTPRSLGAQQRAPEDGTPPPAYTPPRAYGTMTPEDGTAQVPGALGLATPVEPLPAPQSVRAAPGMGEPTPSQEASVEGSPVIPQGTPAPAAGEAPSFIERLLGVGANEVGPDGLTRGDRMQAGFGALTQLGAILMAAGQPMWGNERARVLAGLAAIPGRMGEAKTGAQDRRAKAQAITAAQRANTAAEEMRAMADTVDVSNMPPSMQKLVRAAYLTGRPSDALAAEKEARTYSQPIPLGNGMFWDRATNSAINPITGVRFQLGENGQVGPGTYANGQPVGPDDLNPDEEGYRTTWLGNAVPEAYREQVRAIGEGRQKLPNVSGRGSGLEAQLVNWARQYNPALDQTTYSRREKAAKDYAPSGAVGKTIVSLNTLVQHANALRKAAAGLDNTSLPMWNYIKNAATSAVGGSAPTAFDQVRGLVTRELDNLLSGGRVTISETEQIREGLNSAQSPEQLQVVIDGIVHLAQDRLQSSTQQGQVALGRKGMQAIDEQLKNPLGRKAIAEIENTPLRGSKRYEARQARERQTPAGTTPDPSDVQYLRSNDSPEMRARFDEQFGPGAAAKALGK